MSEICFKCQSQKTIQLEKYNLLTKQAKERAIENGKEFCIWFDAEDEKFFISEYETAKQRSYKIMETFSKFKPN
jgi:hypothetical protein